MALAGPVIQHVAPTVSPWIPVIITVTVWLVGLAIQAVGFAYFMGKLKSGQDGQAALMKVSQDAAASLAKVTQDGQAALVRTFQDFTQKAIDGMLARLSTFDRLTAEAMAERSTLDLRLQAVERNTAGLGGLREGLAGFRERYETHREAQEKEMAHLNRGMDAAQRQLATILSRGQERQTKIAHLDRDIESNG